MALAIFDGVLLHILNTLAPETWQPIKVSSSNTHMSQSTHVLIHKHLWRKRRCWSVGVSECALVQVR